MHLHPHKIFTQNGKSNFWVGPARPSLVGNQVLSSVSGQTCTAPVRRVRRAPCPRASCQGVTRTQPKLPWCTRTDFCCLSRCWTPSRVSSLPSPRRLASHGYLLSPAPLPGSSRSTRPPTAPSSWIWSPRLQHRSLPGVGHCQAFHTHSSQPRSISLCPALLSAPFPLQASQRFLGPALNPSWSASIPPRDVCL